MSELKYLFGPVPSRRLGRSLGINVVHAKICSLDCIYCEAGRTNALTMQRKPYCRAESVLTEFAANYERFADALDVVTVTGAGEPTLNSELREIAEGIRKISNLPLAILTNATLLHDRDVYDTLLGFDMVVPSLDAVLPTSFNKIDRPHADVSPTSVLENLQRFSHEYKGRLLLEILLCRGVNDSDADIAALIDAAKTICADKVQIGTVYRPPAYSEAVPLDDEQLLDVVKRFIGSGVGAETAGAFRAVFKEAGAHGDIAALICAVTKLRPCTITDFVAVFGADSHEIRNVLERLLKDGTLDEFLHRGEKYYRHVSVER